MKKKRELALAVISMLLIALALSACSKNDSSGSVQSPHEEAWLQAYYDVQNSRRPSKAYQAIDYTRSLYFDGHASIEQTQQRIYMILMATPALRLNPVKVNKFIALATNVQPYYRSLSAREIYRRYIRYSTLVAFTELRSKRT